MRVALPTASMGYSCAGWKSACAACDVQILLCTWCLLKRGARCYSVLLLQHGHVTATVSQQLKEQCSRSPQLWKELQLELTHELKAAKKDARDARKGACSGACSNCGCCMAQRCTRLPAIALVLLLGRIMPVPSHEAFFGINTQPTGAVFGLWQCRGCQRPSGPGRKKASWLKSRQARSSSRQASLLTTSL
jgi:hypothetical protein